MFKAHTTSDNNKQLNAVGSEHILGYWLKGRIAAAGLVTPVHDTQKDTDRIGMITKEMLEAYGCDSLTFTKTNKHVNGEICTMRGKKIADGDIVELDEQQYKCCMR